jgi:hypothetical protein
MAQQNPHLPLPLREVEPFQRELCRDLGEGIGCESLPAAFTVPLDRRAVIEFVSARCQLTGSPSVINSFLATTVGGVEGTHQIQLRFLPLSSSVIDAAQQMRVYADPGTGVLFGFSGSVVPGDAIVCRALVSGYMTVTG